MLLAGAAPYAVQLDARRCSSLSPQQVSGLGPDWAVLARYVQRCPVHGPDGRLALSVDIVRLDRAYAADLFRTHPDQAVPRPVLRDAEGLVIGELPEGFPIDPPGRLRVRFTGWRRGFPHEIRLTKRARAPWLRIPAIPALEAGRAALRVSLTRRMVRRRREGRHPKPCPRDHGFSCTPPRRISAPWWQG